MRRLMTPLTLLSSLILFACTIPTATALPQAPAPAAPGVVLPWATGLLNANGDTARVYGRVALSVTVDSLIHSIPVRLPDTLVPRPMPAGLPFMIVGLFTKNTLPDWGPGPFTASSNSDSPALILGRIETARRLGIRLVLGMTGGGKRNYTVDSTDPGVFSFAKWKRRQNLFATGPIQTAIAAAVADGTVIGANLLDEPQHVGWKNSINKALLDSMAVYVKSIFPSLPTGVSLKTSWRPGERLHKIDFIVTQWVQPWGPPDVWRDKELAIAKLDGVEVIFAFNVLNGGAGFAETSCPFGAGEPGRCQMSPAQIREVALALAPYGCALNVWSFRPDLVASAEKLSAFKDVAAMLATMPAKPCRRAA
jgi:hypothetical protein